MKREEPTIIEAVKILENYFSIFNEKLFENELSKPVITISPDTTRGAYGWCTGWKAWKDSDGTEEGYYEINICAESLDRPIVEVCGTLLHEMVHLLNISLGIKDCSRGNTYHNSKFRDAAREHGLIVKYVTSYGWALTQLNEETENFVKSFATESIPIYRARLKKGKNKCSSRKYVCPICGESIRSTHETYLICGICMVPLIEEKKD